MKSFFKSTSMALCAVLMATTAHADMVLINNDSGPNRGVRAAAVNYLTEQIAERTGGAVTVENNWGAALFKTTAALESIGIGVADMGVVVGPYAQSVMPELAMGSLVLPDASPWVMMKAMNELFTTNETIKARMDEKNVVYVNHYALPPGLVACKGEGISSIEDVPGKKMANTGGFSALFNELGANMVSMPIYETYQATETGLVDCSVTYSYFAVATKLNELVDTMTPVNFAAVTVVITFMNKDSFESLAPEHQQAIRDIGAEMPDYYGRTLGAADKRAMEVMSTGDDAISFSEFSAEDTEVIRKAGASVTEKWLADASATGLDGQAVLNELLALIEKYKELEPA